MASGELAASPLPPPPRRSTTSLESAITPPPNMVFLANLDNSVVALRSVVEAFAIDRTTVLQRVHVVEGFEEEADVYKNNMLMSLFQKDAGAIDPVTLMLVRDFLFCADDVADRAEDASDVAIVLVAKGYG